MAAPLKNKILFGIVVYKEVFYETETFVSLVSSYQHFVEQEKLYLFIYDNTPAIHTKEFEFLSPKNVELNYFHNPQNPGISKAYNDIGKFADEHSFDAIIFLDQDTHLPTQSYQVYSSLGNFRKHFGVAIPKINVNGSLLSPAKYINYRSSLLTEIIEEEIVAQDISWINSGMMVEREFFIKSGGYNPKIQLDFSDHFFVEKIKKLGLQKVQILPLVLNQNLSTYTNTLQQDVIRYRFFLRDLSGYRKGKNQMKVFFNIDLPRLLRLSLKYRSLQFLKIRLEN